MAHRHRRQQIRAESRRLGLDVQIHRALGRQAGIGELHGGGLIAVKPASRDIGGEGLEVFYTRRPRRQGEGHLNRQASFLVRQRFSVRINRRGDRDR